jgi:cytoskeletal protein CcmA (bactofilin family)
MISDKEFKQQRKSEKRARKEMRKSLKNTKGTTTGGIGEVHTQEGKVFVEGITNIHGGNYQELFIEGVCNSSNDITSKKLDVEGVFNCNGNLEADELFCEGTAHINGNVRAKTLNVEGLANIDGKLEADHVSCWGLVRVQEEISADVIEAKGLIVGREIVGDSVLIRSEVHAWLRPHILKKYAINFIEATTIELHRVRAKLVNGHTIRIGKKCVIEKIDCSGTLYIHPQAKVNEVVGNYERLTT